jgi:cell division protein FtsW
MKMTRTDRSALTDLVFTIDKGILACILMLMSAGLFIGFAASPAVAERLELPALHFFWRQLLFIGAAVPIIFVIALVDSQVVRRIGIVVFAVAFITLLLVPFIGTEIKGASRWISLGSFTLQPSEFLKPGFIILLAAIFGAVTEENRVQLSLIAAVITTAVIMVLVRQPDYGQTFLIAASFVILLHLSGAPRYWIGTIFMTGLALSTLAYMNVEHVRDRVLSWIHPETGNTYQIDLSLDAISKGGVIGRGIGEGRVKHVLPDAHTDFIFAATAEEFGLLACLILMTAFAVIVWRGLKRSIEAIDPFTQLATAGLVSLFGLQALVNMGVNMKVLPTKGMTLPLVSYGGSSLLALAITTGMILALTRKRAGQNTRSARSKSRRTPQSQIDFEPQGLSGGMGQ